MAVPKHTRDRDHVSKVAASVSPELLRTARKIQDPWFRCQTLANIAYHCADLAKKNHLISESFQAALQMDEPNRIVTVSAWPLKALCQSGQVGKLKAEVHRLLNIIATEPSPVRRADALNQILGAILRGPRPLFWQVFDPFQQACLTPLKNGKRNSKGESWLSLWVLVVDRFDAARAQVLLQAIEGPVLRERALKYLQEYKNVVLERWVGWPNLK